MLKDQLNPVTTGQDIPTASVLPGFFPFKYIDAELGRNT